MRHRAAFAGAASLSRSWGLPLGLCLGGLLGLSAGLWPRGVAADAVPPPPSHCPAGYTPITGHGGPRCVLKPPISCPPGWRGINGGVCVVHTCQTDADCVLPGRTDLRCKPASVCIQEYLEEWGWGASLPLSRDDRALLAEPPRHFDPPRRRQKTVDVCQDGRACPADSTCNQKKLCLPADLEKPGVYRQPKLPPASIDMSNPPRRPMPPPPT